MHWPFVEKRNNEWYRLLTCGFVHSGWIHLIINMFVLYQFGGVIEQEFLQLFGQNLGRPIFGIFYFSAIVAANLPTYVKHKDNNGYAGIGASGAVSAVVFVYIMFNPWQLLWLYAIIPIPALIGGIAYLAYSSWASKKKNDKIDHMAHFYGAIYGIVFISALKPQVLISFFEKLVDIPFF